MVDSVVPTEAVNGPLPATSKPHGEASAVLPVAENAISLVSDALIPMFGASAITTNDPPKSTNISIENLPNELLTNIFVNLDSAQPSSLGLLEEPALELTKANSADLKAVSLVSKRWRTAILPSLFRHSRLIVPASESKDDLPCVLVEEIAPFLGFVRKNSLQEVISSLVLGVSDEKIAGYSDRVQRLNEFAGFWDLIFQTIDPVELLLIAPPVALGALTSCIVSTIDAGSFDAPYHYLQLQRPPDVLGTGFDNGSSAPDPSSDDTKCDVPLDKLAERLEPEPNHAPQGGQSPLHSHDEQALGELGVTRAAKSALFEIRPWTTLLLNEGSFVKAYSADEFWLRQPPSILPELLGVDQTFSLKPYISPTIRDMSYIGIFPTVTHFATLGQHMPRLDRLYLQFVPRNDILEDETRMDQVEAEDPWMERNSCYALVMRELSNTPPLGNYRYLKVFESGDAADEGAWLMAIEFVKRAGAGWFVEGPGAFVRELDDAMLATDPEDEDDDRSAFQRSLLRWAWNGTTSLPVSAYPMYEMPMGGMT
ncbi:hypothetical protein B0O99DRAFT_588912 [Bisporella sp. PMI_857]|nr:hypothetical protein B0O99DRAFT_588912 [Bisporella sp. PMI_857]